MQKIKFFEDTTLKALDTVQVREINIEFKKNKWYDFRVIYPSFFSTHTSLLTNEGYVINNIGVENISFKIKKVLGAQELYRDIACAFVAWSNCIENKNSEWENKHADKIEELVSKYLPHGSGFDNGTKFVWEESSENKLVFNTAFHHMNEGGYYNGWTEHKVIIRPCLYFDFDIKITGRNRNDIKEYIGSCFSDFEYAPEIRHFGE